MNVVREMVTQVASAPLAVNYGFAVGVLWFGLMMELMHQVHTRRSKPRSK